MKNKSILRERINFLKKAGEVKITFQNRPIYNAFKKLKPETIESLSDDFITEELQHMLKFLQYLR